MPQLNFSWHLSWLLADQIDNDDDEDDDDYTILMMSLCVLQVPWQHPFEAIWRQLRH